MLIAENWRPNTWRGYKRTAYTAHNTREEIYEGGATDMYPFALEKGKAEFGKSLCDWLMNHYLVKTGNHYRILKEEMDCIRQGKIPEEETGTQ